MIFPARQLLLPFQNWPVAALAFAASLAPSAASAQSAPPSSSATAPPAAIQPPVDPVALATQKFQQARQLVDLGQYEGACRLFEESQSLDPSPGTLLNIGNCREQKRELLQALAVFQQALVTATNHPNAERKTIWMQAAQGRIASLQQKLPTLELQPSPTVGAQLELNGQLFPASGQSLTLEPGSYALTLAAEGFLPHSQTLNIQERQRVVVALPALVPRTPTPAPQKPPTPPLQTQQAPLALAPPPLNTDPHVDNSYGSLPQWLLGGGAVLAGGGLVLGALALSSKNTLDDQCDSDLGCPDGFEKDQSTANSFALGADLLYGLAAAVGGTGLTLYLLEPDPSATSATHSSLRTLKASCSSLACGVVASGRF